MSSYPVDEIRRDYRALHDLCYLNTGTVGIMSEPVLKKHLERIASYERSGHFGEQLARSGYEYARNAFAGLINSSPDEVTLTRNASDGVNYVLASLNIPANAGFITTDQEHPAVLLPLSLASRSASGSIGMLSISGSDDEILSALRSLLEDRATHLAIISHVSCETGRRLPIKEICALCRDHGVLTLVDGAQSVGQFTVDVNDIGCDFMTGNGHKWLCGPKGTGFLYINRERVSELNPPYVGDGSIDPRFDRAKFMPGAIVNDWEFRSDAQRFEFGTRNWHLYGGVADAVDQLAGWGWNEIQQHVSRISSVLKAELGDRAAVTVHTPDDWAASCGLVTFSVAGQDGAKLSERLWNEHNIVQRRVQVPSAVRISCAHYTNEADIQKCLTALDTILAS